MDGDIGRSGESRDFEVIWRAIPRNGVVPFLSDFFPEKAGSMLAQIALVEVDVQRPPFLRVRLAGTGLNDLTRFEMTGTDYASYLLPEYQQGAVESADLMVCHPCGLWQVMPVHFEAGVTRMMEITCFPVLGQPGRKPMLLVHAAERSIKTAPQRCKAVSVDTSSIYAYLDIGAGVPCARPVPDMSRERLDVS